VVSSGRTAEELVDTILARALHNDAQRQAEGGSNEPAARSAQADRGPGQSVNRVSREMVRELCAEWALRFEMPRHVGGATEAYVQAMVRDLNGPDWMARKVRSYWRPATARVLLTAKRWPTVADLVEAARTVAKERAG